MKMNFKPLGLAAAVAAASAGYAGVTNAAGDPVVANNGLADLALIPYYTVNQGYGTGVHIINTSESTQVVKLRFRRGSDSMDALDLNVILSPEDEWTGFLRQFDDGVEEGMGTIMLTSQDTTCTAPLPENGGWELPKIYADGANEGYIEVISMGATIDELQPIAVNAKHNNATGVPLNCGYVEDNFLDYVISQTLGTEFGVVDNATTNGNVVTDAATGAVGILPSTYVDGGNVLKVSWFIRDALAGLEIGNDAVHIADFESDVAMITHQETGIFSGNLRGFDFPDLDGGSPVWDADGRGKFNQLRSGEVLGVTSVINDWSNNAGLNVATDWIVTFPGQYLMLNTPQYLSTLSGIDEDGEYTGGVIGGGTGTCPAGSCDYRDIPVIADFRVWDREEHPAIAPDGPRDVVVSPSPPGLPPSLTVLEHEVNIVHWADGEILDSQYDQIDVSNLTDLVNGDSGWSKLLVESNPAKGSSVCSWPTGGETDLPNFNPITAGDPNNPIMTCVTAADNVPMVGFVAWERSFPANEDANYGRAIAHSAETSISSN